MKPEPAMLMEPSGPPNRQLQGMECLPLSRKAAERRTNPKCGRSSPEPLASSELPERCPVLVRLTILGSIAIAIVVRASEQCGDFLDKSLF